MRMTLAEAAEAMGALGDFEPRASKELSGVSIDSRTIKPDQLFFCLAGENFDGHNFAGKAAAAGAAAIVAERPVGGVAGEAPVLMVPDSLAAIGKLGAYWRSRTSARVVAVTGSAGKTTVKEMLAGVLSLAGETGKNFKNFNNELGAPLSMLSFSGQEEFWILELGISKPGDMEILGAMVRPDLAVIINAGAVHTEGLGDLAGVAGAKARLLKYLAPNGRALVSKDHPPLWEEAISVKEDITGFSVSGRPAEYSGGYLGRDKSGLGRFFVNLGGETKEFSAGVLGRQGAENVVAVTAAADMLGVDAAVTAAGLAKFAPPEQRFRVRKADGHTLIDDTYNANPLSMAASIAGALEIAGETPLVLVLGDMLELGPESGAWHERLGETIADTPCKAVFYKGRHAGDVARGLGRKGRGIAFEQVKTPGEFVSGFLSLGLDAAVLLFKGSRGLRMEELLSALLDSLSEEAAL